MGPKNKRPATSPLHQPTPPNPSKFPPSLPSASTVSATEISESDMDQLSSKLDFICAKLESMDSAIHELRKENTAFREEVAEVRSACKAKDKVITNLTEQVNRLDQAARSNTLRIIGLPVTTSSTPTDISNIVFREIILPVIQSAKENNDLPSSMVPHQHLLIDTAFVIPAKKDKPIPVILKLSHSSTRNLIFRYKKAALPTTRDQSTNRERTKYSIFKDLTPASHAQLNSLSSDDRVKSVWTYNGQIRFKKKDSDTVFRVKSLSDTFDSVVK